MKLFNVHLPISLIFVSLILLSNTIVFDAAGSFSDSLTYQKVEEFIESYEIPDFVLNSIPTDLPAIIVNGIKLSYIVAVEGMVLLKNNNNALPLKTNDKIAVFGSAQHWKWNYHVGGSSYVEIPPERCITLLEGLLNVGFEVDEELIERYRQQPSNSEIDFSEEDIRHFSKKNNVAIIVIGRYTTEGRDLTEGGFVLTEQEKILVSQVPKYFNKTIVILNTPGPIDMTWDNPDIDAILWVGYPGEQGGNAIASILLGLHAPSGKLPDSWARSLEDYPSTNYFMKFNPVYWEDIYIGYRYFDTFNKSIIYSFGYGLSYTKFSIDVAEVNLSERYLTICVRVKNSGNYSGKGVVQVYISKITDVIETPYQELVAFAKTDILEPGEYQSLKITLDLRELKTYDEGISAWILPKAEYIIRVGDSSRNTRIAAVVVVNRTIIIEDTVNRMHAPQFERLHRDDVIPSSYLDESEELAGVPKLFIVPEAFTVLNKSTEPIFKPGSFTPANTTETITLKDVWEGKYSLENLVAQMSLEELVNVTIGLRGMDKYGIPELRQADGPNGVRNGPSPNPGGVAYPCAPIQAASWNAELAEILGTQIGLELLWANISLWLGPAVNIHRNPLGGRNGEYFSEDPVLSGVIGAGLVRGVQRVNGVGATVKHFVGYEQEFNRFNYDSTISERALREIYLRPFEIIVKTADPWAIMTSYNKVNGVYTGNDPNLLEGIARYEWGFNGFFMTDWGSHSYNWMAYYAGNDALMPYIPSNYELILNQTIKAIDQGVLKIEHVQRCVYNILKVAIRSRAFAEKIGANQEDVYIYTPPKEFLDIVKGPVEPGNNYHNATNIIHSTNDLYNDIQPNYPDTCRNDHPGTEYCMASNSSGWELSVGRHNNNVRVD